MKQSNQSPAIVSVYATVNIGKSYMRSPAFFFVPSIKSVRFFPDKVVIGGKVLGRNKYVVSKSDIEGLIPLQSAYRFNSGHPILQIKHHAPGVPKFISMAFGGGGFSMQPEDLAEIADAGYPVIQNP